VDATSVSLLQNLQKGLEPESWAILLEAYRPFLVGLLRASALPAQDVDDLVQDVYLTLLRELPGFQHNGRTGAFRTWLRGIAANRLRSYWRSHGRETPLDVQQLADQLLNPDSEASRQWNKLHDEQVLARLLEAARASFEPPTYQAFVRVALEGAAPASVAAELNVSVAAVYIAKSRVLRRLRELATGLID
jgi:RNA polymerase sigma-70 factor (ECF subfamily)